jgi:hypothetical protein
VSLVTLGLSLKISMPTKKRFVKMPSNESKLLRTIKKHNNKKVTPSRLFLRSKRRRSKNLKIKLKKLWNSRKPLSLKKSKRK